MDTDSQCAQFIERSHQRVVGGKVVVLEKHEHIMQNPSLQAAHVGIRQSGIQTESLNETVSLSAPNQIGVSIPIQCPSTS